MNKGEELYSGKAKSVFLTDEDMRLIMEFRDDTSAFDGEKVDQLDPCCSSALRWRKWMRSWG